MTSDYEIPTISEQKNQIRNEEQIISRREQRRIDSEILKRSSGINIDELLMKVVIDGASDLHLSCGSVPRYRIDGDLIPMPGEEVVTNDWLRSQIRSIANDKLWDDYNENNEVDLSHAVEGHGRFRVNVFVQRGQSAAVMRTIPSQIKTIAQLGVPDSLNDIIKKPKGLILVTGPTGSGKALRLDTKIPTPTGMTTMGELKIGDKVIDSKGQPTTVTGMSDINKTPELYKITLSDGQEIFADKDHQWIVSTHTMRKEMRHYKKVRAAKNSMLGTNAGAKLIEMSQNQSNGRSTLNELYSMIEANDLTDHYVSNYAIRNSLDFMEATTYGGNGPVPVSFDTPSALQLLGLRLIQRYEREEKSILKTMSTKEILAEGLIDKHGRGNFSIPVASFQGEEKEFSIDPYILGVWLGDGATKGSRIYSGKEDYEEMRDNLKRLWNGDIATSDTKSCMSISLKKNENKDSLSLTTLLKQNGVFGNKHIPEEYFVASYDQRLTLLQGIMDTDGTVNKNGQSMELSLSHEILAKDCLKLIRSLGIKAMIKKRKTGYKNENGEYVKCKDSYRISFVTNAPVFKLKRKLDRISNKPTEHRKWLYINSIEKVFETDPEYGDVRCISVDSDDKSYLCADYVVTHNTTTLTAMLDAINASRQEHIMTIEDPIEFVHENKLSLVNQREVGSDTASFSEALKRVLRQDPDVILIGEMRDAETISTALTAAETGHLVFGTLHTQSSAKTIDRIIDTFPAHQQSQVRSQLADTLQAVICQDLVKKSGGGRVAATEILMRTDAISNNIREGNISQIYSALQTGRTHGMHTFDQDYVRLVKAGLVEKEQVVNSMRSPKDLDGILTLNNDWSA